jgi:hypothetical protein
VVMGKTLEDELSTKLVDVVLSDYRENLLGNPMDAGAKILEVL